MVVKMRALDLLAGHPTDELRVLLNAEADDDRLDGALRRRVLEATVRTYGAEDPAMCERAMSAAFDSDDVLVRYHAARMLDELPEDAAARIGRSALERESEPEIGEAIRRAIGAPAQADAAAEPVSDPSAP